MLEKQHTKKSGKMFPGLEQLFGSKTRFSLLKLFCRDAERQYFMRELARLADNQLNAVRREVVNLENVGIIREITGSDTKKRFYKLNTNFILINELSSLITRSELLVKKNLVERIKDFGSIDLCILTGSLLNIQAPCDILIVGRVNKEELEKLIKKFEAEMDKSIAYTVFSPEEYKQRKALTDKFLFSILENKKMVVVDKHEEFSDERIM